MVLRMAALIGGVIGWTAEAALQDRKWRRVTARARARAEAERRARDEAAGDFACRIRALLIVNR